MLFDSLLYFFFSSKKKQKRKGKRNVEKCNRVIFCSFSQIEVRILYVFFLLLYDFKENDRNALQKFKIKYIRLFDNFYILLYT